MAELVAALAGGGVGIDDAVALGEGRTSHRNRAMAYLMSSSGNLTSSVDECAVTMTARQLARAVRFLANDEIDPAPGEEVLSPALARRVAALMLTCAGTRGPAAAQLVQQAAAQVADEAADRQTQAVAAKVGGHLPLGGVSGHQRVGRSSG